VSIVDISPGWGELLATVRRCENGEALPLADRQAAVELGTSLGLATLPGAVGCSLTVQRTDGGFGTPAAAGSVAMLLDDVQYAQDDGPCLRAARTGAPERLNSMAVDDRWPELFRVAAENGVHSSLSLPLPAARTPSALNLYGRSEDVFATARATALAGMIARTMATLLAAEDRSLTEGLSAARVHRAIAERTLIARAQGVVMAREGLNERLAYRHLAIRSSKEGSPLRDVARRVLDSEAAASGTATAAGEGVSA
jgi:ANTAR domain-containing protein/GAF domain-containing protein